MHLCNGQRQKISLFSVISHWNLQKLSKAWHVFDPFPYHFAIAVLWQYTEKFTLEKNWLSNENERWNYSWMNCRTINRMRGRYLAIQLVASMWSILCFVLRMRMRIHAGVAAFSVFRPKTTKPRIHFFSWTNAVGRGQKNCAICCNLVYKSIHIELKLICGFFLLFFFSSTWFDCIKQGIRNL